MAKPADYMPIECSFFETRKVTRLRAALREPLAEVYVLRLWGWIGRTDPEDDLADADALDIEGACGWIGEEGQLVAAMTRAGFLTEEGRLADEVFGELLEKRDKARKRKAKRAGSANRGQEFGEPEQSSANLPEVRRTDPTKGEGKGKGKGEKKIPPPPPEGASSVDLKKEQARRERETKIDGLLDAWKETSGLTSQRGLDPKTKDGKALRVSVGHLVDAGHTPEDVRTVVRWIVSDEWRTERGHHAAKTVFRHTEFAEKLGKAEAAAEAARKKGRGRKWSPAAYQNPKAAGEVATERTEALGLFGEEGNA